MSTTIRDIFGRDKALIGMVHVAALPGAPRHERPLPAIIEQAADEATLLAEAGFDGLIIENMHDVPYLRHAAGPEIVASMTAIALAVRAAADVPLGVQILTGNNAGALAVAHAGGGQFIRAEGFVFASIADEGLWAEAEAGPLLRYRKTIGAEAVRIFADVKKKHSSHAITADIDIAETARAAAFFGADGLIVTGIATGEPTAMDDLKRVKDAIGAAHLGGSGIPVLVGSGVTADNAATLLQHADGLIVGSFCKVDGLWSNPPDAERISAMVQAVRR